jgi:hypothetical protein
MNRRVETVLSDWRFGAGKSETAGIGVYHRLACAVSEAAASGRAPVRN